jgi:alpha-N-acetylglucosamine transferase
MDFLRDNKPLVIGICVILVVLICYFGWRQGFKIYTSGAQQRFFSVFSSTNQDAENIITTSMHRETPYENYENMMRDESVEMGKIANGYLVSDVNRYANDKAKVDKNVFNL